MQLNQKKAEKRNLDFLGPEISSEPMTSLSSYYFSSNYYCFFPPCLLLILVKQRILQKKKPLDAAQIQHDQSYRDGT